MESKRIAESQVVLSQMMQPEHANILGNVHGGWIMKLVDEAGAIVASRHARKPVVTVVVDSIRFCSPVHVGDLVHVRARLTQVWRTSMEVEVEVEAEELLTGQRRITSTAYLVYVALDGEGRPTPVPPLELVSDDERRRAEEAERRRAERLARRSDDSSPPS